MRYTKGLHGISTALALLGAVIGFGYPADLLASPANAPTKYLLFQIGTYGPVPAGMNPFIATRIDIENEVDPILKAIGNERGDHTNQQLGFVVGPMGFDLTDDQLRTVIRDSFAVAEEKNIAAGFHIDDSMFWLRRRDLWSNPQNVEWSDWNGTVVPHRIIGWALNGKPFLAPPMCYTSPAIEAEVTRIARDVIGAEIKKGIDHLAAIGKPYLFAGVIAGWETRMQDDSQPPTYYGYCALHNIGYSAQNLPQDFDAALVGVVSNWIILWDKSLQAAGIPRERIYTHIAFPGLHHPPNITNVIRDFNKDAPSDIVTFNQYSYPGFSIYNRNILTDLYQVLALHPDAPWGISEGNDIESDMSNPSRYTPVTTMEQYLAMAFNHGAIYVDLFGWGDNDSPFARTITSTSSVKAYQKFLEGKQLQE